jgi:hypothetical protein
MNKGKFNPSGGYLVTRSVLGVVVSALILASCQNNPPLAPEASISPQAPFMALNAALPLVATQSIAIEVAEVNTAKARPIVSAADAKALKRTDAIIEHSFSDGSKLRFRNIAGHALQESDVAVADTEKLPEYVSFMEKEIARRKAAVGTQSATINPGGCSGYFLWWCVNPTSNYLWTTRFIPYEFENTVTAAQQTAITDSINRWNAKPGMTVKWQHISNYTGADRTVIFKSVYSTENFCGQAYIGYQGRVVTAPFKRDFISLNTQPGSCFTDRTIHHEMGHAIGFPHEQTRCDRDQYVYYTSNEFIEAPNCGNDYTVVGLFDFDSIMLYDSWYVNSKRNSSNVYNGNPNYVGNPYRSANVVLSSGDITTANWLYYGR